MILDVKGVPKQQYIGGGGECTCAIGCLNSPFKMTRLTISWRDKNPTSKDQKSLSVKWKCFPTDCDLYSLNYKYSRKIDVYLVVNDPGCNVRQWAFKCCSE